MLKNASILFHGLVAVFLGGMSAFAAAPDKLAAERALVQALLIEEPAQQVLAVDGLCCRNCAIGIGKKVSQLDFIDTLALPKGIKIDRKNGLLSVAVKEGAEIDRASLVQAIRKAGYDPVRLYQRAPDASLKMTEIPREQ